MAEPIRPLLAIVGPTASGKSAFAMQIAQQYGGEIICADSRTIYKGMDVGTAKPSLQDRQLVPHHLLDVVQPGQPFSAAEFKKQATIAIHDIVKRDKLPILVGGTGLYVDSVLFDYQFGKPADPQFREQLDKLSTEQLQSLCKETGAELPINSTNRRHLIRAIELGGLVKQERLLRPDTLVVGIATEKEELQRRITDRIEQWFEDGIMEEAKDLAKKYGWDNEAMTANIYRIVRRLLNKEITLQEAKQAAITSDMQLAKRQLTWLRRNPYIVWGRPTDLYEPIEQFIDTITVAKLYPY